MHEQKRDYKIFSVRKSNSSEEEQTEINLANLANGQQARLIKINTKDQKLRQRFLDMGLTPGVLVTVKNIAPLGSPITLILRDYQLSVRKHDLTDLIVEVIK